MTITREQAEKIREAVSASITPDTGAGVLATSIINALGGVEAHVVDGWTFDGTKGGWRYTFTLSGNTFHVERRSASAYINLTTRSGEESSVRVPAEVLADLLPEPVPPPGIDFLDLGCEVESAVELNLFAGDTTATRRYAIAKAVMAVVRKAVAASPPSPPPPPEIDYVALAQAVRGALENGVFCNMTRGEALAAQTERVIALVRKAVSRG